MSRAPFLSLLLVTALLPAAALANADAAKAAANGPSCSAEAPFYWEIGDAQNVLASGSVGGTRYTRTTSMTIASASKWIYGAWVEQVRGGALTAVDTKYLTFKSGYVKFDGCEPGDTVGSCATDARYNARADGRFYYSGGHMQAHAAHVAGLAALDNAALAATMNSTLGIAVSYSQPQIAGGVVTSAAGYATFLRRVMGDYLVAGSHLADAEVCTQASSCRGQAIASPVPEPWQYGVGHWVELDGTFSSPGAFGFYPWISADKRLYGIVSRNAPNGAWTSVTCGRAIRAAFLAG